MWLLLALICCSFLGTNAIQNCPIFQTTDPRTPCYLLVLTSEEDRPVPPFVYAFSLPHPSRSQPCPIQQSLDSTKECFIESPRSKEPPGFVLAVPLPKGADKFDESLYVTKSPSQLSFPNPHIQIN